MRFDYVLDTSAMIARFRGETGGDLVESILAEKRCAMHTVNVAEFCLTLPRKTEQRITPEAATGLLDAAGIMRVELMTDPFLWLAARVRLANPPLSVGDGLAVALASVLGVPLLVTEKAFEKAAEFATIKRIR